MSKVDELDHRIGRHEGKPNSNCPLCNPEVSEQILNEVEAIRFGSRWWDHRGGESPAFPDWGAVWVNHKDEVFAFIKEGDGAYKGGFWAPVSKSYEETVDRESLFATVGAIQTEFGSGNWSSRVKMLNVSQTMPGEAAMSSPLGVDLPKMASQQNRAKLIVGMSRSDLFPVSEIAEAVSEDFTTRLLKYSSTVYTVPIPPENVLLADVSPR